MTLLLVLVALVGVGYVAVNIGSKEKTPLAKIAVLMVVVCLATYLAYPYIAPFLMPLIQFSQRL